MQTILVKYAEIALKGRNRRDFEARLIDNIRTTLGSYVSVVREYGRIRVSAANESRMKHAAERLSSVFGIHSFAHARAVETSTEAILEAALEKIKDIVQPDMSFAVETRRSDKAFALSSQEVNELVGTAIQNAYPDLVVDLAKPSVTLFVEIREQGAYVYTDRDEAAGPGGLPVGATGRGLALLSGGIDSPIACWLAMKRGMSMDAVYFHSAPYTGEKARGKVIDLLRVLARWQGRPMTAYMPSLARIQKHISEQAPAGYWTILFRRSMQRIAQSIQYPEDSRRVGYNRYNLIVTGDSLAQVASQTPENLTAVDAVSEMLTIRPLIGYNKQETIDLASKVGTYEISIRPYQDCCSVFTPQNPKTKARLADVERAEARCAKLPDLEQETLADMTVYCVTEKDVTATFPVQS